MANWNTVKTAVADVINANGNQAITGQLLQNVLNNIITNVGENATFAGIATLDTNPGTPDGPVFYLTATAGTYPNFNGIEVQDGEAVILLWNNNAWSKKVTGFATQEKLSQLGSKFIGTTLIAGDNEYELNKGTKYYLYNKGNVEVGIYYKINDSSEEVFILSLKQNSLFSFVADENSKIIHISVVEGAIVEIYSTEDIIGKVVDLDNKSSNQFKKKVDIKNKNILFYQGDIIDNTDINSSTGELVDNNNYFCTTKIYTNNNKTIYAGGTTYPYLYCYKNDDSYIGRIVCKDGIILSQDDKFKETFYCRVIGKIEEKETLWVSYESSLNLINGYLKLIKPVAVRISKNYINASNGQLGISNNYTAYTYIVENKNKGVLTATTGSNNIVDGSIAFYSGYSPSPDNCIKVVPSIVGVNTYTENIPENAAIVVVSTRDSIYNKESIYIEIDNALDSLYRSCDLLHNKTNYPINIKAITFNAGNYDGKNQDGTFIENGSEKAKYLYRELFAHNKLTIASIQSDVDKFGKNQVGLELWGMYKYYTQAGDRQYNYSSFASSIPIYNPKQIYYTGSTFLHDYFYVGEIILNGINILVVSFHLDWQDKKRRSLQYQQIVEYAHSYKYAIIAGDTNCENYEDGIKIDDTVLIDEWNIFAENGYTLANNGYFGIHNTYEIEPIDNIFVKGNIVINNFEVIQKDWMYDHYMLVADLSIYT